MSDARGAKQWTSERRSRWQLILIALALLGIAWAAAPRLAPPLYDGVNFPDEPYRFVVKPPGTETTKAPTTARNTVAVHRGVSDAVHASSAEQANQIALLIPVGRLTSPRGTTTITVAATPAQPLAAPPGKYLWSNVYDVVAGAGVTLKSGDPPATITMRAATAQRPIPTIERWTGSAWVAVHTEAFGNDIYDAELPSLGRYAVFGDSPLDLSKLGLGGATSATSRAGIVITIAAVVVIVALFVAGQVRRSSIRKRAGRTREAS